MWQTQYEGSSGCGVFVDLQKTINTVDPKILLHKVYQHCKVHHFADNRNTFHTGQSVTSLNKLVNRNMKRFNNWLSANKISCNVEKTELVIFKSPRKVLCDAMKIKLVGKRLYPCNTVKYCGVDLQILTLAQSINGIAVKPNKSNALLVKIRSYVNMKY